MRKNLPAIAIFLCIFFLTFFSTDAFSQPFTPVPINGFNNDVVAEAGTSSLTTTTVSLDGFTISNKVMYTNTFKTLNSFGGGGIPDNGVITDAAGTYQLGDYTSNNALLIQRNQTGDINITTPAQFDKLRLLCFSTEGTSLINGTLFFTDGTSTPAITNYSLGDWFNTTTNLVLSGFGRCRRATPATGDDAYPNNPRLFYIEIPLSCTDRQKNLQRINLANVTTAGTNAPYPNAVFFAVSATSYSQNITELIHTDETCSMGGTVTLDITGSGSPYSVTWNTIPVQNGLTASGLSVGIYTATITDAAGCVSTRDVTIVLDNDLTMSAPNPINICFGGSANASITSNATGYAWTPTTGVSNPGISSPVLSPASTTTYTITGTLGSCTAIQTLQVNVANEIHLTVPLNTTICTGSSFNSNTISDATTYSWAPTLGVSNPAIASPVFSPANTTTYTITATTGGCSVTGSFTLTVASSLNVSAGSDVTVTAGQTVQLQGSGGQGIYLWIPATGLNAANILDPVASPAETTTYTLTIITNEGCTGSDDVKVEVVPDCAKPMNAITPNGDGVNDRWLVTYGNCLNRARVSVYNRYGSKVFDSKDYKNDWEGTYKGKPVPDGTYYYIIDFILSNGRVITLRGDLTILR